MLSLCVRDRMMTKTVLPLLLFAGLLAAAATSAGATPFFTQDPRTLPQGKWRVGTHLLFSDSDDSLVNGEKVPFVGGDGVDEWKRERPIRAAADVIVPDFRQHGKLVAYLWGESEEV